MKKNDSEFWLFAKISEVRKYLSKNLDMKEYQEKKQILLEKIEEQRRRDLTEKYIETHCGNYTEKEKTVVRNSLQVGWELRKNYQ